MRCSQVANILKGNAWLNNASKDCAKFLGYSDNIILSARCQLATTMHFEGNYSEATKMFKEVLEMREKNSKHLSNIIRIVSGISEAFHRWGPLDEAIIFYERTLYREWICTAETIQDTLTTISWITEVFNA